MINGVSSGAKKSFGRLHYYPFRLQTKKDTV